MFDEYPDGMDHSQLDGQTEFELADAERRYEAATRAHNHAYAELSVALEQIQRIAARALSEGVSPPPGYDWLDLTQAADDWQRGAAPANAPSLLAFDEAEQ